MTESLTPIARLRSWKTQARDEGLLRRLVWRIVSWLVRDAAPPADAVALATADAHGHASVRMVLVKTIDPDGLLFFTNYGGRKARELEANPWASLLFYWPRDLRQVRVEGAVEKLEAEASDAYWKTRPRGSQLAAWASAQSTEIESDEALRDRLEEVRERFRGQDVPRPPFWGGYRLVPVRFEFWTGRPSRLHERECYERDGDGWRRYRLMP